jgi:hypothetical protein
MYDELVYSYDFKERCKRPVINSFEEKSGQVAMEPISLKGQNSAGKLDERPAAGVAAAVVKRRRRRRLWWCCGVVPHPPSSSSLTLLTFGW